MFLDRCSRFSDCKGGPFDGPLRVPSWAPRVFGSRRAVQLDAEFGCYTDAALSLNGVDQYAQKTSPTFAPTTKMTIAFDYKPTTTAAAQTVVARMASGTQNQFSVLVLSGGALRIRISSDLTDTSNYTDTTETLSNGTNARIVIVYDGTLSAGSRLAVYINGVAATLGITGTIPATLTTSTDDLTVGTSGGGNFADGALARLGFSSQALSGAALTAAHTSTFWADMSAARQADWFSFYNLCEASGTRVDSTGLNDLTAVNTPTVAAGPGEGRCVNNSPVKRWEDRSGNGRHLVQATIANQPIWRASILNGLGVVDFDGVSDYIAASGLLMGSTYTCGALTERSGSANRYLIGAGAAPGSVALISRYADDFEFYGASPRITIAASGAAASGFHSVAFGGNSGGMATRFDGAASTTSATAAPTGDGDFTIGAPSGVASDYFDGQVSEVVLSTAYGASVLASLDSYLNAKR